MKGELKHVRAFGSVLKWGGFIALSALAASCSGKPDQVLSEGKMVSLLTDMQLAECYADNEFLGSDRSERKRMLARQVLARHGVTQEELDSSFNWYGRNYDDFAALYAKVDKELKKRERVLVADIQEEKTEDSGSLWPWSDHGLVSKLGNSDGWVFSLDNPEVEPGERIQWRMHLKNQPNLAGMMGVEYTDGTVETSMMNLVGRDKFELTLRLDTGRTVERVFGTLRTKPETNIPVYADSIRLVRLPYDSTYYMSMSNNRRYAPAVRLREAGGRPDSISVSPDSTEVRIVPEKVKDIDGGEVKAVQPRRPKRTKHHLSR